MVKLTRPVCPNPNKLKSDYSFPENKQALKDSTSSKCMYCESKVTHVDYGDVEHILPKAKYPNKKFDWSNLGYSCVICNRDYKKECDDSRLINPYEEDPIAHLDAIGPVLVAKATSSKGDFSCKVLGLNRIDLVTRRAECLIDLERLAGSLRDQSDPNLRQSLLQAVKDEIREVQEFSLVKRTFLIEILARFGVPLT